MKIHLKALRAPFLAGSLVPVIIGSAFAFSANRFSFSLFLLCSVGVSGLHLGANLLNDYFDDRGSDPINVRVTPFSGGSRVIQNRELTPSTVFTMALFFFAIGLGVGIWLVCLGRPLVIPIGVLGLGAGWAYSSPPFQLMSRGWGEAVIFLAFGPLITLGTYYVMTGLLSWPAFAIGAPQGFFIAGVIWINQFPDYQADRKADKKNLVVRLGPGFSRYLYCAIMSMAFVTVFFLIEGMGFSYLIMLSLMAFPMAVKAMRILWREYLSHSRTIPAQALTIQTLIAHGLLISIGMALSRFV
ncbi:MAG: 1,4-dihydroxy-2-naphthoate octaprenyltransferase [Proteobacteria bacterium]|jgi:1,4-dihydroxy-2-naphthoate octaprenyltransferase|nr:1,4-dihydroxy-2-naphthoate octaprenyltransferase [Desulfobacterales bacterium]MBL6967276.1 1,4-dihydroxy-2-naphthoate octaprenyltransferase [Desulfobacteraceae bacterium]MBL7172742.1 1,4-dihydroxy-2-naphthoate octaprenyltransferase [Desulfobacteraceae bacterium]MBU0732620.1 1,4-dihydroxy-2-naphthoate octaprenyltransferase [Pseudomonadota bacterium]MBU1905137.1 1,4-dihydroxy-2-naphthoate octaprenyltransferase [Pseudomonadota bacterium]